ncbi:CvpA family protein [Marinifilum flexuosum]|uniref:Membrane protein required for colicin V production n=1 Tax=Marinifilum flexuosum TaxID=1117708 RepID=A0A419X6V6_9BACT|nr:CvpA family protein [Marinifilum flexuosum]RKE03339.1 membrane protein required for colicin V production [Marinifilum flexuosum]
MNILDILIGLPLIYAIYKGFTKGLIIEIATLLALILGIYGAIHFSDFTAEFIENQFDYHSNYMGIIAFISTFLVIVIVLNVLGKMLNSLIEAVALGMINRLLGAVFGLIKGILILSILVYFVNFLDQKFDFISKEKKEESLFYKPMVQVSETIFDIFNSDLGDTTDKIKEKVQKQLPVEV